MEAPFKSPNRDCAHRRQRYNLRAAPASHCCGDEYLWPPVVHFVGNTPDDCGVGVRLFLNGNERLQFHGKVVNANQGDTHVSDSSRKVNDFARYRRTQLGAKDQRYMLI
ncbi:MAG TPA: hypothetical protein VK636_03005 [Gemmatimonadaceae bacterium]|nr:hypothetical protein [Gemmatimonadaceae bacterium]